MVVITLNWCVLWCWSARLIYCYNVELEKVGIARGVSGSQFGYALGMLKPGGTPFFGQKLVLLVGSPNMTFNNITAHGEISACENLNMKNITCTKLNVNDGEVGPSKCDILRGTGNDKTICEKDSRLGATIAINKNYREQTVNYIPLVTVCAPGWKNVWNEPLQNTNQMIGACYKLDTSLQSIRCDRPDAPPYANFTYDKLQYCWPFWAIKDYLTDAKTSYIIYTYAEAGISATYSLDGQNEVIGAPGIYVWRGGFKLAQYNKVYNYKFEETNDTTYLGYSVATGYFLAPKRETIAAGVPNRYDLQDGHFGQVEVVRQDGSELTKVDILRFGLSRTCVGIPVVTEVSKNQRGTKYGAVVAAVDIDNNGTHELLIGAPLYTSKYADEGRVYIYTSGDNHQEMCGPVGILSGGSMKEGFGDGVARFGSAIASIGDIDRDNYTDFAVGAPYEEDGRGAVYIYMGISNFKLRTSGFPDMYSQRLPGKMFDSGIRGFGWSIYGDHDIDENSFPDFAVGAYSSDTVAIFRSRPIVHLKVNTSISPSPIPLNASLLRCSMDRTRLCTEVNVTFSYENIGSGKGTFKNLLILWYLEADTYLRNSSGYSRFIFRNTNRDSLEQNITLSGAGTHFHTSYILDVIRNNNNPEPKDAWTKVMIEGTYKLLPQVGADFSLLNPILRNDTKIVAKVEFDKKCETLDQCKSDLVLSVEMDLIGDGPDVKINRSSVILAGERDTLAVTIDVKNVQDISYNANFTSTVTANKRGATTTNQGSVSADCEYPLLDFSRTDFNCTANNKLDRNENFKVFTSFDISMGKLIPENDMNKMITSLMVDVIADQENLDVNPTNNKFKVNMEVRLKYDIYIQADQQLSDQDRYKAVENSDVRKTITHQYYITNYGPSYLPKTYVNITVPVKVKKGNNEIAKITKMSPTCNFQGNDALIGTTLAPTTSITTPFANTPGNPDPQRRRRAVDESVAMASTGQKQTLKTITCLEYECIILECLVMNLDKNVQTIVNVTIEVFEKALAAEKDFSEIRYTTNATVTDPEVWYGGKVVPMENTVYATVKY
ncbi:integrin alpha-4-like [Dreissena polymorpha]|uniref:integrin alpha-4-like n=1 Tax=Dreissena polymorpha TaxID=45954 RepID=UPI00226496AD|nr:integrin alpha-4-like [Dreissena polymorpha]